MYTACAACEGGMMEYDEVSDWLWQQAAHERNRAVKDRAARYMADVRHPLKARRLDERGASFGITSHHRPFSPQAKIPSIARCSHCGQDVPTSEGYKHGCFTRRCWSRKAKG